MRAQRGLWLLSAAVLAWAAPVVAHPGARAAEARLDRVLSEGPSGPALVARAAARRERGDLGGASDDVSAAEAAGGVSAARLALERARNAAAGGALERADALFGEALDQDRSEGAAGPSHLAVDALVGRATVREHRRDLEAARSDWDAAFAARPTADVAMARGAIDEATGELTRAAAGYREGWETTRAVGVRRALARVELARGAWEAARQVAEEAMEAGGFDVEWRLIRASAHEGAGRHEEAADDRLAALAEAERAVAARPSDLRRLAHARALLACGRAPEALRAAEAIARSRPGLREAAALADEARALAARPRRAEGCRR